MKKQSLLFNEDLKFMISPSSSVEILLELCCGGF